MGEDSITVRSSIRRVAPKIKQIIPALISTGIYVVGASELDAADVSVGLSGLVIVEGSRVRTPALTPIAGPGVVQGAQAFRPGPFFLLKGLVRACAPV